MKRIHYFPLEPEPMRYSEYLDEQITNHFHANACQVYRYETGLSFEQKASKLPAGQFLNAPKTIFWKMRQLAQLAENYRTGVVQDGDTVFLSDLWCPGIEAIRYLDFFTQKRVRLIGLLHAGSYTDTDFVRQLERWAGPQENVWFDIFDRIIVFSEFHRRDVLQKRLISADKIIVSRLPIQVDRIKLLSKDKKSPTVVFNGRLCDEKQPHLFQKLEHDVRDVLVRTRCPFYGDLKFVSTQLNQFTKEEYYQLLGQSAVAVSFALQENFGIAMIEAAVAGCVPVVPNRLAYPEFYKADNLYADWDDCVQKVVRGLYKSFLYNTKKEDQTEKRRDIDEWWSLRLDFQMERWFQ